MHHIGSFPQLEDQMTNFASDFDREAAGYSPDRLDAPVWATTQLLVDPMNGGNMFELYRSQAAAAGGHREISETPRRPQMTLRYSAKFRCDNGGNELNALSSSTY